MNEAEQPQAQGNGNGPNATSNINHTHIHNSNPSLPSSSSSSSSAAASAASSSSTTSSSPSPSVSFSTSVWFDFDLSSRRSELDRIAIKLADEEIRSASARQQLSAATKSLKRSSESDQLKQLGAVLKHYQSEINNLTQRAQTAENEFLGIYKFLIQAADPAELVKSNNKFESELVQLRSRVSGLENSLSDYDKEFSSLKNQEYTIRKLEAENREFAEQMEGRVAKLAQIKNSQVEEELNQIKREMEDREREHTMKIQNAKMAMANAIKEREFNSIQTKSAEESVNSEIEEIAHRQRNESELADLSQIIARLKAENSFLRAQEAQKADSAANQMQIDNFTQRIKSMQIQLDERNKSNDELQNELNSTREKNSGAVESLAAELKSANLAIASLTAALAAAPSPAAVQRLRDEIREFELRESSNQEENRRLTGAAAEVNRLKLAAEAWQRALEEKNAALAAKQNELEESKSLASKLEANLQTAIKSSSQTTAASSSSASSDSSIVSLVAGQRDRYSLQVDKLSRELAELKSKLNAAALSAKRFQSDNLVLYEKLKVFESSARPSAAASASAADGNAISIEIEQKYSKIYEEKSNPFKEFAARQTKMQESAARMGLSEKLALNLTRLIASKRGIRKFLFVYALLLHGLIGIVLWSHTIADHCEGTQSQMQIQMQNQIK